MYRFKISPLSRMRIIFHTKKKHLKISSTKYYSTRITAARVNYSQFFSSIFCTTLKGRKLNKVGTDVKEVREGVWLMSTISVVLNPAITGEGSAYKQGPTLSARTPRRPRLCLGFIREVLHVPWSWPIIFYKEHYIQTLKVGR